MLMHVNCHLHRPCSPISGLTGHDQMDETHIYQCMSGSGSRSPLAWMKKAQRVAEPLYLLDYLVEPTWTVAL